MAGYGNITTYRDSPATLGALNAVAATYIETFSDVIFKFTGTTVQTVTFEYSEDSTNGTNGTWFPILATNIGVAGIASSTAVLTSTHSFRVSAPSAVWVHAKTTAYTSGSSNASMSSTTTSAQSQITATLSSATVAMTSTTIAAPAATIAGVTIAKVLSAAGTNPVSTKATAGRLLGWTLTNTSAAFKFLKFYNKATAPTVGTDVPVFTIAMPPNTPVRLPVLTPITFATGIAYAITGGYLDNDTTVVVDGDVIGAFFYV